MSLSRLTLVTAIALAVFGCSNVRPGYEVITSDDTGVYDASDVRADIPRDIPTDVQPDVQLADGFSTGSCTAGDAMACAPAMNADTTCQDGHCIARCRDGFADCDGLASNGCEATLSSDPMHCGSCANACTGGSTPHATATCVAGTCGIACAAGFSNCDMMDSTGCERQTATDPSNCGTCGTVCPSLPDTTPTCTAGACSAPCTVGHADCDSNSLNGCETQTVTDRMNCGACGHACVDAPNATVPCTSGACTLVCNAGFADCDHNMANGCEVATGNDLNNCGACGTVCHFGPNSTAACSAGACSLTCTLGFADCDGNATNGCEVALNSTAAHCGSCANACPAAPNAAPMCSSATCSLSCNPGFSNCNGNATDGCEQATSSDIANCGGCGISCAGATNATPHCATGVCSIQCIPNFFNCDGNASNGCEINTQVSATNCGSCGTICSGAPNAVGACTSGTCHLSCNPGFSDCNGNTADGCELNTATDVSNCGGCARVCPAAPNAMPRCSSSICSITCVTGFSNCDGNAANGCETVGLICP